MTNTLLISFKVTDEHFNVPYQSQTTVHNLIKHVCTHTTMLSNANPEDYYLAINKSDMLDGERTVEEMGLGQPNQFVSLDMYMKTRVLIKRISQSRMQFLQVSDKQIPQEAQQSTAIEKVFSTGIIGETTVDLRVVLDTLEF
jgi:hypothetical protein